MPFTTTVVESYPEQGSGFLQDPEGGGKIYFDCGGWCKKVNGELVCAHARSKKLPPEGSKIEVVQKENPETGHPLAKVWRLVERGKRSS